VEIAFTFVDYGSFHRVALQLSTGLPLSTPALAEAVGVSRDGVVAYSVSADGHARRTAASCTRSTTRRQANGSTSTRAVRRWWGTPLGRAFYASGSWYDLIGRSLLKIARPVSH
jgi:hypothetical protein